MNEEDLKGRQVRASGILILTPSRLLWDRHRPQDSCRATEFGDQVPEPGPVCFGAFPLMFCLVAERCQRRAGVRGVLEPSGWKGP